MNKRFHQYRCGTHEGSAMGTEYVCNGSCLNEGCDECDAAPHQPCEPDCAEAGLPTAPVAFRRPSDWQGV